MIPDGELTPRWFDRRADGFRHAARGGLWLAPLIFMTSARFGPGWYGKVVSADPERLLRWAAQAGVPARGLEAKSIPDLDSGPRGARRRIPAYHIDLWGSRLRLAYDAEYLALVQGRVSTA